jgi:NADH-quinone oxidoreductase subunit C
MMEALDRIKEKFGNRLLRIEEKNGKKIYIDIAPADLTDAAAFLYSDLDLRYMIITGLDRRDGIELLYHFAEDSSGSVFTLRVFINDRKNPTIKSLTALILGITWIEREIHELLGVNFEGHPNMKHLLLGEDWPEGNYPLRNDQNRDQRK